MSLIKCSECKGKVSDMAPLCPHCGTPLAPKSQESTAEANSAAFLKVHGSWPPPYPLNNNGYRKVSLPLLIGAIFLPIVFCWFFLRKGYSSFAKILSAAVLSLFFLIPFMPESHNTNLNRQAQDDEIGSVAACETKISKILKDPDSAEYKEYIFSSSPDHFDVDQVVRARNGFNAMLRSTFHCTVVSTSDGYRVESVNSEH